jgi:two-component system, NarL family, response regulator LiaR
MIRVLIVDDQRMVCEGLRVILNASPHIEVVGVGHDGYEALDLVNARQPDLVLMDLKMPRMNGIQATRAITERYPDVAVLVLTTYDGDEWVFDAIRAGAAGYLLKDVSTDDMLAAIEGTVAGRRHIDPAVAAKILDYVRSGPAPDTALVAELTDREQDILKLVAHGLTNHDIAGRLCLAEGTVRNHVSALLSKLHVNDRTQAAALAWRHGLVTIHDG